jgi:arginyl-tRNA--protein-N-Asp/Glu arginylyltransferase
MGHWMETTLFAMQLAESNDDMTPMEEQLALFSEYQEQWGKMLEKHPMQWQQFSRLMNLDTASLQSVSGRQTYVHQLERTMAVFKDL